MHDEPLESIHDFILAMHASCPSLPLPQLLRTSEQAKALDKETRFLGTP